MIEVEILTRDPNGICSSSTSSVNKSSWGPRINAIGMIGYSATCQLTRTLAQ
jgi:hypothetical protein